MAARLPTACVALAALFGAGWWVSAAHAKPPDLPIKEQIFCGTGLEATLPQVVCDEDDIHARAARAAAVRLAEHCLLFAAHPLLALAPVDSWFAGDDTGTPSPKSPVFPELLLSSGGTEKETEFTCPYLREKAGQASSTPQSALPHSALDNLANLEQAASLYRQARSARLAGREDETTSCCQKIHALCPGSRYDQLAGKELEKLHAQGGLPVTEETGEEAEVPPPPQDDDQAALGVECQVAQLLERCQCAFTAGRFEVAELLARRALALSPESVAAHPMVYKLHLLTLLNGQSRACSPAEPGCLTADDSGGPGWYSTPFPMQRYGQYFKEGLYAEAQMCALQALALNPNNPTAQVALRLAAMQLLQHPPVSLPPVCPWASEPHSGMALRQPTLPPVDPTLTGAMEKILTLVGEPSRGPIAVTVEEHGTGEESEPAATRVEVPTLFIDTPSDDPVKQAAQHLPLQDVLEALHSMACAEVENFPFCSRGRCQVELGCMVAEVRWDQRDGHGSLLFGLGVTAPTDLRADQWDYNNRVVHWIERHAGSCKPDGTGMGLTSEELEDTDQP
jgi:tetratricopeptide (TPR) repeat protein